MIMGWLGRKTATQSMAAPRENVFRANADSEGPGQPAHRTVWSGPSLSANRIIGYQGMFQWREMPVWDFAYVQYGVIQNMLYMFEGTSLDAAHIKWWIRGLTSILN